MTATKNPTGAAPPTTMISGYRGLAETLIQEFDRRKHHLSVLVRNKEALQELQKKYPHQFFFAGDLASKETLSEWVNATTKQFGKIDNLINNAAVTGPAGVFHEISIKEVEETIQINLISVLQLCHEVLPHFIKQGSGVVINLSGGGATYPRPRFSSYAITKCALLRFTETLSEEYSFLRFYAVSPGSLMTPMIDKVLKMNPNIIGKEYDEALRRKKEGGDPPEKAAELMLWLIENQPKHLSGKLISAIWDNYKEPLPYPESSGYWTLRRVDEVVVKNLSKNE